MRLCRLIFAPAAMRCAFAFTFLTRRLVERVGIRHLRDVPGIDFAGASPILTEKYTAGEPQWLGVLRMCRSRPLEPDAGNAAEGSEGLWRASNLSHARNRAWLFVFRPN